MKFDPKIHHRRSIRLQGYDYTSAGAYFITMVTRQRECLFGEIQNGAMTFSAMGQIADENWRAIPGHFPQVELGAFVVMPNHVHGIILLNDGDGCRDDRWGTIYRAPTGDRTTTTDSPPTTEQYQKPVAGSIPTIVRTYKASVTRRIQKELNSANIWQRNYYEHIIRSDEEHNRIHLYIEANIDNWPTDNENPVNPK